MAHRTLISTRLSTTSAAVLALGGLVLLFAGDDVLPRLIPGFPATAAWVGQLAGAGWLAMASLSWLTRSLLLGGIYGRYVVVPNAILYFVTAMSLLKIVRAPGASPAVWLLFAVAAVLAALYAWLMFRGPLEHDMAAHRANQIR
jgi:hypothetical protein